MKNRLKDSTSPYLLQHAQNPVAWFPWGDEALELAKKTDKPILLSIGYAACHWCHVMAHESFEDEKTASIMNEHFICIKVDREERPDLDQIYMTFVQMTTGSGGWPLNVFLSPDLEPFYGGTYFPPEDRYGRPSWKKILLSVNRFYHDDKSALNANLEKIRTAYDMTLVEKSGDTLPTLNDLTKTAHELALLYDPNNGGLGKEPKFPAVQPLTYFLYHYHRTGESRYLDMVTFSLNKMACGGIYDQIGGGFARYTVDGQWRVPHFEKMLYDNAQLAVLYLQAHQITKDPYFEEIVRGILGFVSMEMRHKDGGFYSSLDADSEGVEGKYYIWSKTEIDNILGDQSNIFCNYFGVSSAGNFEGKNILYIPDPIEVTAKKFNKNTDEIKSILAHGIKALKLVRDKRIRPGLDDKILTSWNALMLSAYARAFQAYGDPEYKKIVEQNIDFIKTHLLVGGQLLRTYNRGKASIPAYLDDYAYLIGALFDAYEAFFNEEYLQWAYDLLGEVNRRFYDKQGAGYFYTAADHQHLIYRMKDVHDQSTPSATGIMLQNLLRFYTITEDNELLGMAERMIRNYLPDSLSNPYTFGSYLQALDYYLTRPYEFIFVTKEDRPNMDLLTSVFTRFLPHRVVILIREGHPISFLSNAISADKKSLDGKTTVYLCHNFACSQPVTESADLLRLLP